MKNEILIAKASLSALKNQLEEVTAKADALIISIREKLNPYDEFLDLDVESASILMKELNNYQHQAKEFKRKIDKIECDLSGI